jgi:hypothetical protein
MESLKAVEILLGIVVIGLGWWNTVIWAELKDARVRGHTRDGRVSALEVLVAGGYVTRPEMQAAVRDMTTSLSGQLDKLSAKMDSQLAALYAELKHKADK